MREDLSSYTWIELRERPPPISHSEHRRCWCFFRLSEHRQALGHYLGNGRVKLLHTNRTPQAELELEPASQWRPVSLDQLAEFDNA